MNAVVLGGALLYLLAGLWPSLFRRGVATAGVRLTVCGLLFLGAAVSITGGLRTSGTSLSHAMFATVHGAVALIAVALAAGTVADHRSRQPQTHH